MRTGFNRAAVGMRGRAIRVLSVAATALACGWGIAAAQGGVIISGSAPSSSAAPTRAGAAKTPQPEPIVVGPNEHFGYCFTYDAPGGPYITKPLIWQQIGSMWEPHLVSSWIMNHGYQFQSDRNFWCKDIDLKDPQTIDDYFQVAKTRKTISVLAEAREWTSTVRSAREVEPEALIPYAPGSHPDTKAEARPKPSSPKPSSGASSGLTVETIEARREQQQVAAVMKEMGLPPGREDEAKELLRKRKAAGLPMPEVAEAKPPEPKICRTVATKLDGWTLEGMADTKEAALAKARDMGPTSCQTFDPKLGPISLPGALDRSSCRAAGGRFLCSWHFTCNGPATETACPTPGRPKGSVQ